MDKKILSEQVHTIRQAFGYINRFKGRTFVIKIDGALIAHHNIPILIRDIALLKQIGIRIVLVPGARSRIDDVLKTYHIRTRTVGGVRISTPKSIPFIKMAAFDISNKIMTLLSESNCTAVIGNWVRARQIGVIDGVDYKSSGRVEKLDVAIVNTLLEEGVIPIFPNIGWNAVGTPYNISSNELAFTISRELGAAKLFFLTDTPGINGKNFSIPAGMPVSSEGIVSQFNVDEAKAFLDANAAAKSTPAVELLKLAHNACVSGVKRVHIVDGRVEGMILKEIFSNRGLGTMVHANTFENIRPMEHHDIPDVLSIMQPLIDNGKLIKREPEDIERSVNDYVVYEVDGTIHGCGALQRVDEKTGEIAGLAVDDVYAGSGIGTKIVSYLIERAIEMRLKELFVLTTQSLDWFLPLGFTEVSVSRLPRQKQKGYSAHRKSKILAYKPSRRTVKTSPAAE